MSLPHGGGQYSEHINFTTQFSILDFLLKIGALLVKMMVCEKVLCNTIMHTIKSFSFSSSNLVSS